MPKTALEHFNEAANKLSLFSSQSHHSIPTAHFLSAEAASMSEKIDILWDLAPEDQRPPLAQAMTKLVYKAACDIPKDVPVITEYLEEIEKRNQSRSGKGTIGVTDEGIQAMPYARILSFIALFNTLARLAPEHMQQSPLADGLRQTAEDLEQLAQEQTVPALQAILSGGAETTRKAATFAASPSA